MEYGKTICIRDIYVCLDVSDSIIHPTLLQLGLVISDIGLTSRFFGLFGFTLI